MHEQTMQRQKESEAYIINKENLELKKSESERKYKMEQETKKYEIKLKLEEDTKKHKREQETERYKLSLNEKKEEVDILRKDCNGWLTEKGSCKRYEKALNEYNDMLGGQDSLNEEYEYESM